MTLTMLPCGCVVDIIGMNERSYDQPNGIIAVECPFCGDTFDLKDIEVWIRENRHEIIARIMYALQVSPPLIEYKGKLFEILMICGGCGAPIVRDTKDIHEHFHLRVPQQETVRLRN